MIKLLSTEELAKQLKNSEAKIAALNSHLQELKSSPGLLSTLSLSTFSAIKRLKKSSVDNSCDSACFEDQEAQEIGSGSARSPPRDF